MTRTLTGQWVGDLQVGDIVCFHTPSGWARLRMAIARPRKWVVTVAGQTTVTVEERRLTWAEWRGELVASVRGLFGR